MHANSQPSNVFKIFDLDQEGGGRWELCLGAHVGHGGLGHSVTSSLMSAVKSHILILTVMSHLRVYSVK